MKTLYLLRHAHAEPQGSALSDFDRALDEQGRAEAEAIGQYLYETGLNFDLVMCSAALRAQETFEPLRRFIKTGINEISEEYYNISEEEILNYLKQASDKANMILYVGHNPGLVFTILRLARIIPDFVKDGIQPATLVGFQIQIDKWSELDWREGDITDIYHPNLDSGGSPEPMKS